MTPEQMRTETTDSRPWFERVMRWGQLTLVEDDPVKYDENFWLDYFERTRCDGVLPERRRVRRLLPHRCPAASPQSVAR